MCDPVTALTIASSALGGVSAIKSMRAPKLQPALHPAVTQQPVTRRKRRPAQGEGLPGPEPLSLLDVGRPVLLGS